MRFAVLNDRASIVVAPRPRADSVDRPPHEPPDDPAEVVDVESASDGSFSADAAEIYARWPDFAEWAEARVAEAPRRALAGGDVYGSPSPRPTQVFGIGVNYADHAGESDMAVPAAPLVFAKFASSITGMSAPVVIDRPQVDWEAELVVVIGRGGQHITAENAWSAVAGLSVGQDISDRELQFAGDAPQFNLGKSRPGYGPVGPWLVTPNEFEDPDDLAISCRRNGELVQESRTSQLINSVPALVAYLSSLLELRPGDLIFTGTPAGVGFARRPPVFLQPGDELVSSIEGIGELRTTFRGSAEQ